MKLPHLGLALLVVFFWGMNLIVAQQGLNEFPPLFFVFVRLFLACVPAIFFVKWPKVHWCLLASYALFMFLLQFTLIFLGINAGVTPGLAAILIQSQVFFTVLIGWGFLKEKIHIWQILGGLVGLSGIAFIGIKTEGTVTLLGLILVVMSAMAWSIGNALTKKMPTVNFVSLIVWASFICCPFSFAISYFWEGPEKMLFAVQNLDFGGIAAALYMSYVTVLFTFIGWSYLLRSYPVATIAPLTLAAPIITMTGSALFLNEPLQSWKIIAALIVLFGLSIDFIGTKFFLPKTEKF